MGIGVEDRFEWNEFIPLLAQRSSFGAIVDGSHLLSTILAPYDTAL